MTTDSLISRNRKTTLPSGSGSEVDFICLPFVYRNPECIVLPH